MTSEVLLRLVLLFAGVFVVGTALCLPLYQWNIKKFFASKLWTKILWWVPIFSVFIAILNGGLIMASIVALAILLQACREFYQNGGWQTKTALLYFVVFWIATLHLAGFFYHIPYGLALGALIVVCFASVLSDVCAFFLGTYFGRTALPGWINPKKSWEGVLGQIIGAFIGYGLVWNYLHIEGYWGIVAGIGVMSALGDLINSAAKRSLNIKDWGETIPGHGGVLDRFSSLSMAIAWTFWVIR